jgi:hypothetical protein
MSDKLPKCHVEEVAERLTSHHYGIPASELKRILLKLTAEERHDLLYVLCRASEKLGSDALYPSYNGE